MDYKTVLVERKGPIGIITLNRPEKMNTFTTELAKRLNEALVRFDDDEEVRVVVVRGAGKAFSTGIDVYEFFGKTNREYKDWVAQMEEMSLVIAGMKKPVIASAHGYVVANGAGLLLACDLAVVAEGTKIGTTAINVGLFCMGPAVPLSRHLGKKRCLEMLLTGDLIDARVAEQWGLVNRVVPLGQLEQVTMELAEKLAKKSPIALQMGKQAYYGMQDMEFGKALEYSNEMFATLCVTEDAQAGVRAFLEKRKPDWKGR
ncbi:MAG: enoyl-CoA hydratase/isomerase family protein [Deltaproteobacteria bacterium]|nr:enoyl-CoA hydratase/isomerase family protein [Deltaproteobacteria bacterium]